MPAAIRRHWTADDVRELITDWSAWPRYEVIDGELLVTPSPGDPHQVAVVELVLRLAPYCDDSRAGMTLLSPADLELQEGTIVQPDVFVVYRAAAPSEREWTWKDVKRLLLAVEVLSPSSVHADRVVKRDFYLAHRVAEYWVVDLDAAAVEVWTPQQVRPRIVRDTIVWQPQGAAAALRLDLPAFFQEVRDKARLLGR